MQLHFDVNDDAGRQEFLYQTVPALLSDITGEEKALWGQFAPQHMLEHLSWAVEASVGKIDHPLSVPDEKASLYREFLFNDLPTKRLFRHPLLDKVPPPLRFKSLDDARKNLLNLMQEFEEYPDIPHMHSIFGLLDHEEWERMHYKHFFHHLMQFGLIQTLEAEM